MSVLYVDTSALLKRVVVEPESSAVRSLLHMSNAAGDLLTASSLAWLEVWRALRWAGVDNINATVRRALSGVAEYPLQDDLLVRARRVGKDNLRSLDSIHLASALSVSAESMLTYDVRLAESAAAAGLAVLSPT